MRKLIIFLALFVLIPSVFAQWYYDSKNVITNIDISSDMDVVQTSPNGYIESATVNMTFYPKQTSTQELLKFQTNPKAEQTEDTLKFTWKRPEGNIGFNLNAEVKTTNFMPQIRQKINFPIENLPDDVIVYTKPSETIDSNDDAIIKTASELVSGEDDLYSAVFKIADWTKNTVNYNLSTLSAKVTQKASWVLQYKQGVCAELTSLFVALLRSVGIPARVVSGMAYTNSPLFPQNWGAHAWAEVYFPNYGWVPFDVTYGEFGWVDPTHIKFKDAVDTAEPSTYYNWLGRNADLKTKDLEIKTNLIEKTGYYQTPLSLESSILKNEINFGSYNLVTAAIENLNDFYYATELYINKPKEVKIIGDETRSVLLLPGEKKKVFWILKIDDNLDKRYSYTFPIIISTISNISASTSFVSNIREKDISFEEVEQVAKLLEEEKQKKYSGNVELNCATNKEEFYEYEDVKLYCNARNTGNLFLDNVGVCFENKCSKIDLGISQAKKITFEINKSNTGIIESEATLRNDLVSKVAPVKFKIDDAPKIAIEDLDFPLNISYNENFNISFTLSKKSLSNPENVEVVFSKNGIEKKWSIGEMAENRKFVVDFAGKDLRYGKNDYSIQVNYHDKLKKSYSLGKQFSIELANVNLWQRFLLWVNDIFKRLYL